MLTRDVTTTQQRQLTSLVRRVRTLEQAGPLDSEGTAVGTFSGESVATGAASVAGEASASFVGNEA